MKKLKFLIYVASCDQKWVNFKEFASFWLNRALTCPKRAVFGTRQVILGATNVTFHNVTLQHGMFQ